MTSTLAHSAAVDIHRPSKRRGGRDQLTGGPGDDPPTHSADTPAIWYTARPRGVAVSSTRRCPPAPARGFGPASPVAGRFPPEHPEGFAPRSEQATAPPKATKPSRRRSGPCSRPSRSWPAAAAPDGWTRYADPRFGAAADVPPGFTADEPAAEGGGLEFTGGGGRARIAIYGLPTRKTNASGSTPRSARRKRRGPGGR